MDSMASPPPPGSFAARKMRVDSIMRALADRHEAKRGAAYGGFASMGKFLAQRRSAAMEAAILRAAVRKN